MTDKGLERKIVGLVEDSQDPLSPTELVKRVMDEAAVERAAASSALVRLMSRGTLRLTGDRTIQLRATPSGRRNHVARA